jgi:hypothetical protein
MDVGSGDRKNYQTLKQKPHGNNRSKLGAAEGRAALSEKFSGTFNTPTN